MVVFKYLLRSGWIENGYLGELYNIRLDTKRNPVTLSKVWCK